ncbi:MAG: RIP metalloprotease RseP [Bacteroidetes bacterium 47-18]|nr:MAG: RIP metalloprotease RseP [Bacteroidetes bacterium 47-18]
MDTLISVAQFLCALSLLVILHEFGHYFFAKLFRTKVEKFYLFFDFLFPLSNVLPFSFWKKKIGETEYGIGWFPLGGYVKIAGMVDESMDTEQMKQPPKPWEFRSKKAWQRLLIMLGGIIVNILLAFIIYAMVLFTWGEKKLPMSELKNGVMVIDSFAMELGFRDGDVIKKADGRDILYFSSLMRDVLMATDITVSRNGRDTVIKMPVDLIGQLSNKKDLYPFFQIPFPAIIQSVEKNSGAERAHLQPLDEIVAINEQPVKHFFDARSKLQQLKGHEVTLRIKRENQVITVRAQVSDAGTLGFQPAAPSKVADYEMLGYTYDITKYGFFESFPAGVALTWDRLAGYVGQFKKILNPQTGAYKAMGGFASMSKMFGPTWNWEQFWHMTAFISVILAFMNLLPIPGLDGGYVLFILYEMITGRKPKDSILEKATAIGLLFLLLVMLYANGLDIFRGLRR